MTQRRFEHAMIAGAGHPRAVRMPEASSRNCESPFAAGGPEIARCLRSALLSWARGSTASGSRFCSYVAFDCSAPILPSAPASSRAILDRCITHSSTASTAKSSASLGRSKAHSIAGVAALAIRAESEE